MAAHRLPRRVSIGIGRGNVPARLTREHQRAHDALHDWASWQLTTLTSTELGFQIMILDGVKVQTPPKALIPRVAFTPPTVKAIENFLEESTQIIRSHAYYYFIEPEKKQVTRRQYYYLLDIHQTF